MCVDVVPFIAELAKWLLEAENINQFKVRFSPLQLTEPVIYIKHFSSLAQTIGLLVLSKRLGQFLELNRTLISKKKISL